MGLLTLLDSPTGNGGWTPPSDTYPTAFSPTQRSGYAGATFGVWADGGMRTVKHDSTTAWLGIQAMSGLAAGQKFEWKITIEGSSAQNAIFVGDALSSGGFDNSGNVFVNGVPAGTIGTFTTTDVIHVAVSRVTNEMTAYKQTGGVGAFSLLGVIDLSAITATTWYPLHSLYDQNCQVTYDFGQTAFTSQSGFARGPIGPWGPWNITSASVQGIYTSDDLTRMWTTAAAVGASAPNVASAGDPVGGWYDWEYKQALTQSTAGTRPEYQTDGILFDSTSVVKQMLATFSRNYDAPCWHAYKSSSVTGTQVKSGFVANSGVGTQRMGFNQSMTSVQTINIRSAPTISTVSAVGSDISGVMVYEGATAFAILDNNTRISCTVGTGTTNTDRINIRGEVPSSGSRAERRQVMVWGTGSLSETESRNLQYWMETAYP